jgi:hypothetical protein
VGEDQDQDDNEDEDKYDHDDDDEDDNKDEARTTMRTSTKMTRQMGTRATPPPPGDDYHDDSMAEADDTVSDELLDDDADCDCEEASEEGDAPGLEYCSFCRLAVSAIIFNWLFCTLVRGNNL